MGPLSQVRLRGGLGWLLLVALTAPAGAESEPIAKARQMARENLEPKIVLGEPVPLEERPWQVALVLSELTDDYRGQFCGGTLIVPDWVLTAAHCVDGDTTTEEVEVLFGSATLDQSGNRIAVRQIRLHPAWNPATRDHDAALLQLSGAVRSQPPLALAALEQLTAAETLEVSGWGKTDEFVVFKSRGLLQVQLPLVSHEDCTQPDSYGQAITPAMFCAGRREGGEDACRGDSGGPATVTVEGEERLAGIISWGEGCGRAKKYGVYTTVPQVADWIRSVLSSG